MSWTEERVELLKTMWADGKSASQIAKELGSVTRNAVIGKVHRLGLASRTAGESDGAKAAAESAAGASAKGSAAHPTATTDAGAARNPGPGASGGTRPEPDNAALPTDADGAIAAEARAEADVETAAETGNDLAYGAATAQPADRSDAGPATAETVASSTSATGAKAPEPAEAAPEAEKSPAAETSGAASGGTVVVMPSRRPIVPAGQPLPPQPSANEVSPEALANVREVEKGARKLTLMELTERTCKWPIGDPATEEFWFCGLPVAAGKPYCEAHVSVAFQPMQARRDRRR